MNDSKKVVFAPLLYIKPGISDLSFYEKPLLLLRYNAGPTMTGVSTLPSYPLMVLCSTFMKNPRVNNSLALEPPGVLPWSSVCLYRMSMR